MQVAAGAAFHTTSATDGRHDTVSKAQSRVMSKQVSLHIDEIQTLYS